MAARTSLSGIDPELHVCDGSSDLSRPASAQGFIMGGGLTDDHGFSVEGRTNEQKQFQDENADT